MAHVGRRRRKRPTTAAAVLHVASVAFRPIRRSSDAPQRLACTTSFIIIFIIFIRKPPQTQLTAQRTSICRKHEQATSVAFAEQHHLILFAIHSVIHPSILWLIHHHHHHHHHRHRLLHLDHLLLKNGADEMRVRFWLMGLQEHVRTEQVAV